MSPQLGKLHGYPAELFWRDAVLPEPRTSAASLRISRRGEIVHPRHRGRATTAPVADFTRIRPGGAPGIGRDMRIGQDDVDARPDRNTRPTVPVSPSAGELPRCRRASGRRAARAGRWRRHPSPRCPRRTPSLVTELEIVFGICPDRGRPCPSASRRRSRRYRGRPLALAVFLGHAQMMRAIERWSRSVVALLDGPLDCGIVGMPDASLAWRLPVDALPVCAIYSRSSRASRFPRPAAAQRQRR